MRKYIGLLGLIVVLTLSSCGNGESNSTKTTVENTVHQYEMVDEKVDLSMTYNQKMIFYYTDNRNWEEMYQFVNSLDYKLDGFYYIVFVDDKNVQFPNGKLSGLGFTKTQSKRIVGVYTYNNMNDYKSFSTYEKNSWDSPSIEYPSK